MMWSSTIRVILISLALAAWSAPSFAAPMVVATSSDAAALAENLAGAGITIVSATLEAGDGATAGTFLGDGGDNDRDAFLAFDSGVVLSTGPAEGLAGSNDEDYGGTGSGLDLDLAAGASCDDDSASLAHEGLCDFDPGNGQSVFDATWLEIVFIPEQDELTLTYVFASEEWNADGDANAGDVLGVWVNEVGCALTSTGSSVGSHSIHSGTPELFISNGAAESSSHCAVASSVLWPFRCIAPSPSPFTCW